MTERKSEPPVAPDESQDAIETARRIMGQMVRTPPKPHEPLGKPRKRKSGNGEREREGGQGD